MTRFLLSLLATLAVVAPSAARAQPQVHAAWVQVTGQGAEARAVAAGADCPQAVVDGEARPMTRRTAASADFPAVCSLAVPAQAQSLSLGGRALALPAKAIDRVVILGDTGCRVLGLAVQACNDDKAWPFASVARLAAARKPDLVIHVGDYYYRETPCPLDIKACVGSPYGDHWDTWAAEFFDPAAPLLAAAPWVFARGNHESCSRGGRGWYALLDSGPP
ncbi:MAG: Phosphoprotein phosphatase, partial [Caulobacteraceae bacterium]|nr:Phosphoprotein phosphatase [Caulobacteraceae bacterium]